MPATVRTPHPRPLSHPHSRPPGEGSDQPKIAVSVPLPPLPGGCECGWERGARGVRDQSSGRFGCEESEERGERGAEETSHLPEVLGGDTQADRSGQEQRPTRGVARAHPVRPHLQVHAAGLGDRLGGSGVLQRVRPRLEARAARLCRSIPARRESDRHHEEDEEEASPHRLAPWKFWSRCWVVMRGRIVAGQGACRFDSLRGLPYTCRARLPTGHRGAAW